MIDESKHGLAFTAADIESVTHGAVDRKTAENWHNRKLWLTTSYAQSRGKPRLYSKAGLFEALTRATLVRGGFTHRAALRAFELRFARPKAKPTPSAKPTPDENRYFTVETGPVLVSFDREVLDLPEIRQRNTKANWYWAIHSSSMEGTSEPVRTDAFKRRMPVADIVNPEERIASILFVTAIVRDVFAYVEQKGLHSGRGQRTLFSRER